MAIRLPLIWLVLTATSFWSGLVDAERPVAEIGVLDPIGTWNCLIYQEGAQDDAALLLRLSEAGYAEVAEDLQAEWLIVASWNIRNEVLTFVDERDGRRFQAGLRGLTLAGLWRDDKGNGEWWCSPLAVDNPTPARPARTEEFRGYFPLPKAELMVAPKYPVEAIREGREGVVVVCFKVGAEGNISEPRIVELSHPIFRDPTLVALDRSRYAVWPAGRGRPARPGCRTYRYRLMPIYD